MKSFLTLATSILLATSFTATADAAKKKPAVDHAQACRDQYKGQYANGHQDNLVMIARCRAERGDVSNRR